MKNKALLLSISTLLLAISICMCLRFAIKKPVAEATTVMTVDFDLYLEDVNHILADQKEIVTNKQVGVYFYNTTPNLKVLLSGSDGQLISKDIVNSKVEIPMKNGVTYDLYFQIQSHVIPAINTNVKITYDLEKPRVTACTQREEINNNETVIAKKVLVSSHDNFAGLKMYVSHNNGTPTKCKNINYELTKDGTYTFYAVDIAGNYSDDFTISYYETAPPEEPTKPTEPIEPTPTEPTTPIEPNKPTENQEPEKTSEINKPMLIAICVAVVLVIGLVVIVVYKKIKAKTEWAKLDINDY